MGVRVNELPAAVLDVIRKTYADYRIDDADYVETRTESYYLVGGKFIHPHAPFGSHPILRTVEVHIFLTSFVKYFHFRHAFLHMPVTGWMM